MTTKNDVKWSKFAHFNPKNTMYTQIGYLEQAWLVAGNASSHHDADLEKAERILRATRKPAGERAADNLAKELRAREDERKATHAKLDMQRASAE